MKNLIFIDDDREYTLSEFAHNVKRVLSAIADEAPPDLPVSYPGREVYFCIIDLLGWINDRVPGEFRITQDKSKHYHIVYSEEKKGQEKARHQLSVEKAKTALSLEQMTGQLPVYANKPEIAQTIESLRNGTQPVSQKKDKNV